MISRTPYRSAHASLIQLQPRPTSQENKENLRSEDSTSVPAAASSQQGSQATVIRSARKHFDFPRDSLTPRCKLDETMQQKSGESKEVGQVEDKLHSIRERLASGAGCAVGERDSSNVWIQSALGALLCQPPKPEECVQKCNSIRVFLYDMGLINRPSYGNELISLDPSANV